MMYQYMIYQKLMQIYNAQMILSMLLSMNGDEKQQNGRDLGIPV